MSKKLTILAAALLIGVVNGVVFVAFEALVQDGTLWLWNDVFNADVTRWLVLPLAIVLGILFSFALRLLKQPRWVKPQIDLLAGEPESKVKTTLKTLGSILAAGAASLLAGASLGPEAPLTDYSKGLGKWTADRTKAGAAAPVLVLASLGALMTAFFGSMLLVLLPILFLYRKTKKLPLAAVLPIVLAGLASYGILWLFDRPDMGFGTIPTYEHLDASDYVAVVIVGAVVTVGAFGLKWLILKFANVTKKLDVRLPWYYAAALFGAVIGLLYLLGGQSVQFSGSTGSHMLFEGRAAYGTLAFLGFAVIKFLVTAWSKASGYRGGLVFPSVYAGVALGLMVGAAIGVLEGSGALVGAVGGIFTAVIGSPVVALLFLVALLPFKLMGLAIVGIAAATISNRAVSKYLPSDIS